jgi:hypothetical protein
MCTTRPKILCIGKDATLLKYRCAVLAHGGYGVIAANVPDAYRKLRVHTFALVIISERLAAEQKELFETLSAETRTLVLDDFIFPAEMLVAVEKRLNLRRPGISLVRQSRLEDSNLGASRFPTAEKPKPKSLGSGFRTQLERSAFSREVILCLLQEEDQAARILRQLFDAWVDTGLDESGEEHPRERKIGKATAACTLLESYVQRHPPKLFLGDGEHAIKLQDRGASPLWVLGSRTTPTTHQENAANVFIQFLGQEWCFEFAKCRECGRRFDMKRSPARKYQFGIHCALHQNLQSRKAAILATQKARHIRHMQLLSLAVHALQSGNDTARRSSKQILETVNEQDSDGAKRLGMTAYWITRNREQIETLAKNRLDPQSIPGRIGAVSARLSH